MVKSTAKRRSASPAAERATAQSEPARVTKQSVPPPSLSGANAEARSTARPLKAGKPQSVRASGGPAPGSREAAQQQAELDKSKADAGAEAAGPRRFRGAAPWAARHAAKRAAEFAARNQEPPRPGSARATLRTPEQAESIKARVTELHQLLNSLRSTKKHLKERFLEAGELLRRLRDEKLFEAKGYS
ncbi:MAG TPA: hypothetical protein VFQ61_14355, partial [Polyangiaceae bacterium]|nr:hypothetical protein [Polyangiaceae bacterium]